MTSRVARLWQPGNPQRRVYLPDFWLFPVSTPKVGRTKLPKNCVKFQVDPRMSKHDVNQYLTKIYKLPVRDVRTEVQMGEITWNTKPDYRYKRAMWKEEDKKFAFVFMKKDFEFVYPDIFHTDEELQEITKAKSQQDKINVNSKFVNRDRGSIGEFFSV